MWYFLFSIMVAFSIFGCLEPMNDPQSEKIDSEVQCGFGSVDC